MLQMEGMGLSSSEPCDGRGHENATRGLALDLLTMEAEPL